MQTPPGYPIDPKRRWHIRWRRRGPPARGFQIATQTPNHAAPIESGPRKLPARAVFVGGVTLRNFVSRAEAIGMEYNIVEAIDQPWKFFEGGVGPYWGILNAAREPKFAWSGPVVDEAYWKLATIALLVGVLMSLPILRLSGPTVIQSLMLSAAANGVGAWVATVFAYWNGHYFVCASQRAPVGKWLGSTTDGETQKWQATNTMPATSSRL